jgi:pyridoxal phosphate enzyme (YggS family)
MELTIEELIERKKEIYENVKSTAEKFGRSIDDIKVLAVSKTHSADTLMNAIEAGITAFGESYVQEFKEKQEIISVKSKIQPEWHYIGHLQTNKVKYIAQFVSMIHSVDSVHLAEEIQKQADKHSRNIDILLQVNTSGEASKSGCEPDDLIDIAEQISKFSNLKIRGLMTIGTFSDDEIVIRKEFNLLRDLKEKLGKRLPELDLKHLSMGMSHDYPIAIQEGATIIRIGTAFFGERYYG